MIDFSNRAWVDLLLLSLIPALWMSYRLADRLTESPFIRFLWTLVLAVVFAVGIETAAAAGCDCLTRKW